jgi:hypothetical protein
MFDLELRDTLLQLAALTDELTRRLDVVEPLPAPSGTLAPPSSAMVCGGRAAAAMLVRCPSLSTSSGSIPTVPYRELVPTPVPTFPWRRETPGYASKRSTYWNS